MSKRTFSVALGGIIGALAVLMMFFTGISPILVYTLPAAAGVLFVAVVVESGHKWAFSTYVAVSILSFFITPDKEAVIMFVMFFGYYPIVKSFLEKIKFRLLEWIVKLAVFNSAIITSYLVIIHIFGLSDVLDSLGEYGKYGLQIFLLLGNIVFVIYDVALTRLISSYIEWFRPRFLRKIK